MRLVALVVMVSLWVSLFTRDRQPNQIQLAQTQGATMSAVESTEETIFITRQSQPTRNYIPTPTPTRFLRLSPTVEQKLPLFTSVDIQVTLTQFALDYPIPASKTPEPLVVYQVVTATPSPTLSPSPAHDLNWVCHSDGTCRWLRPDQLPNATYVYVTRVKFYPVTATPTP